MAPLLISFQDDIFVVILSMDCELNLPILDDETHDERDSYMLDFVESIEPSPGGNRKQAAQLSCGSS